MRTPAPTPCASRISPPRRGRRVPRSNPLRHWYSGAATPSSRSARGSACFAAEKRTRSGGLQSPSPCDAVGKLARDPPPSPSRSISSNSSGVLITCPMDRSTPASRDASIEEGGTSSGISQVVHLTTPRGRIASTKGHFPWRATSMGIAAARGRSRWADLIAAVDLVIGLRGRSAHRSMSPRRCASRFAYRGTREAAGRRRQR